MAEQLQAWVQSNYNWYAPSPLTIVKVDLGGSLAVASWGLFATGVSTDLNGELPLAPVHMKSDQIPLVTYLNSGGQVGDVLKAVVHCDKCTSHCIQQGWY